MKIKELRSLTVEELNQKLVDLKQELFNLRFSQATGNLPNPMQIHNVKKDIASVNTLLKEKKA